MNKYEESLIEVKKIIAQYVIDESKVKGFALKSAKTIFNDVADWESIKVLQELIKRSTPMKPIIDIISAGTCGMTYENYQCPNCRHGSIMVGNYKDKVDYCHDCGQALDWSE